MKRVALVAAHFAPSNLAAVHRSRLWAQHLPEFGWEPVIVTTHWSYYEEKLDWDLCSLVSPNLRIIRTRAIPTKPLRIIGELGVRALLWHYAALSQLAACRKIDFLVVTVPSHFSAVLGRLVHRRFGVPYGIDYIDPWIHRWPGVEKPLSKAWLSYQASKVLEPWAVKHASLITGVAPLYYEEVLNRNPELRAKVVSAAMPYGGASEDFGLVRKLRRRTFLFDADDDRLHFVYAGAMLPKAYPVLERLLAAIKLLTETRPEIMSKFHLHFVGTGRSPDDVLGYNIRPYIERYGVCEWVSEHPARIGYVDALNHLSKAAAVLILGSTEAHYSPSKVFQALQCGRPVLALLHEGSTAVSFLQDSGRSIVIRLTERALPSIEDVAGGIISTIEAAGHETDPEPYVPGLLTARESARQLAQALDEASLRHRTRAGA